MNLSLRRYFSTYQMLRGINQAASLANYSINFIEHGFISPQVLERTKMFHTDSVICALSALAMKTNAPHVLRNEALRYTKSRNSCMEHATVFGSNDKVCIEKAILANCSAVREWNANGTVFGYSQFSQRQAGEFGHNDFYPVVIAAAHVNKKIDGATALKAMVLQDQIRGRLCERFSLRTYKIDHVINGAIASICVYGALVGASPLAIEHAIGMFIAHYTPWRAVRAGKQLGDSEGASAALSAEAAIMCIKRTMRGFIGPSDIFRNPETFYRNFGQITPTQSVSDMNFSLNGSKFAVNGMHFKLGIYDYQAAAAIQGIQQILLNSQITLKYNIQDIAKIEIIAYEPAFGSLEDTARKDPTTRQQAYHSMAYIVSTVLRKAFENVDFNKKFNTIRNVNEMWMQLMLEPKDYGFEALFDKKTRALMKKCTLTHGEKSYDKNYPQGIPTSVSVTLKNKQKYESGLVVFPSGHSSNTYPDLPKILQYKNHLFGKMALNQVELSEKLSLLNSIERVQNADLLTLYNCKLKISKYSIDDERYI